MNKFFKLLLATSILVNYNIANCCSGHTTATWTIDKALLVKQIGNLIHSQQIRFRARYATSPIDFMPEAQGSSELAKDLYVIHTNCITDGGRNQEILTAFCEKYGIKTLSAKYKAEDYR